MADTHIHIHLNGEEASTATSTPRKPRKASKRASSPPTKAKRKVSAYSKTMGAELKRLKKKHPRAKAGSLMKKAHAHARKKHRK
tara:strand:- start:845 stop:1096 length:252 start_codon:yes stop_codon:yes gene_type:complete